MVTKVKRHYDASRRREQAQARRLAVVLAARELFERDGFRPTTIAAVAAHAGVSAESIYKGFGTKAALAKAVFDLVIAGDDEPVPVAERPAAQAMREEPDVRRKIAMFAEGLAQRQARSATVQILIRDGRHVDDSLAPVWAKLADEGLTGMTMLGRHLLGTGQLRDGIGLDEVRDVLWNYLAIDSYERLVLSQGWPLDRYTRWLTHAIISAICSDRNFNSATSCTGEDTR
jgi:AcrR family transcriptional regulator